MIENVKIYKGNCLEVMDKLIDEGIKVDAVITDPPYKITARGNGGNSGGMFQKKEVNNGKVFANNDIEIEDWLPLLYNILKDKFKKRKRFYIRNFYNYHNEYQFNL